MAFKQGPNCSSAIKAEKQINSKLKEEKKEWQSAIFTNSKSNVRDSIRGHRRTTIKLDGRPCAEEMQSEARGSNVVWSSEEDAEAVVQEASRDSKCAGPIGLILFGLEIGLYLKDLDY
ncbi:hypothetical protein ES288_A06G185600v1 [Gossypium darwinii]|uniref:Uncharacterized protein n=1 Tax=Gossypium darwinii TaxID=34276 RepID=A0A5D2G8K7_GOSDA|nr:hypothetical protein ES288_A06G185600v1 [Gossypium darwinii]